MCVGKTNNKVSQATKDQAEFARRQAATHERVIRPQEIAEAEQLGNKSYQAARGTILEGRANADAAGAELQAQRGLRSNMGQLGEGRFTGTGLASAEINSGSQEMRSKGVLAGYQKGQGMTMGDRFDALQTGQGHARGVNSGLGATSRNEMIAQQAEAQGEMQVGRALGGLAVTAGMGGYTAMKRAGDSDVASADLSLLGKGLRGMGMGQTAPQPMAGQQEYGAYRPPTSIFNSPYAPQNNMPGATHYPQSTMPEAPTSKWQGFRNYLSGNGSAG
jgi:hypothetical protein